VGIEGADDAAVFRLADDLALVQSVDFFTPIVDDANDWGRIAAANALSDIYAMGARPLTALQLVGWPRDRLPFDLLGDVLEGGASVLSRAGCVLVGGHSIDDPEPKYGFAVTGIAHPDEIVGNDGGRPGDALVLTKPIGTGLIATGVKRGITSAVDREAAVEVMANLNDGASRAMQTIGVRAATDVTGFGLLGHLREMLGDRLGAEIEVGDVPLLGGAVELAEERVVPGGTARNLEHAAGFTDFRRVTETRRLLLADAQTSGGLLIAVADERVQDLVRALEAEETPVAATVGRLVDDHPGRIVVVG
jgi:selenide,water dikinase